jgi:hypothetical protein
MKVIAADNVDLAHPHSEVAAVMFSGPVRIAGNQTLPLPQLDAHYPGSRAQFFHGCKNSRRIVTGGKETDASDVAARANEVAAIFQVK